MKNYHFTIIIATHKREKLLERAINSVLNQTYKNNNFIAVSDAHDEPTFSLISKLLRPNDLFVQRNGIPGPSESRNIALQLSNGTHVIFLDDDDAFHPNFLKNLVEKITDSHTDSIFYTNAEVIDCAKDDAPKIIDFTNYLNEDLFVKNFLPNNCIVYPINLVKNIEYDSSIDYEDWDYLLSAISSTNPIHIPIQGPIIFKNSDINEKARGEKNNNNLINCYLKVYAKHAHVKKEILDKRIKLFQSINLDLELLLKEHKN